MVICGDIALVPGREDEVTNPVLIVEVLSEATRNYDRGEKFALYKTVPSFREYLLVEQQRVCMECHRRDEHGLWSVMVYDSPERVARLTAVSVELPLVEVYRKVFTASASH